MARPVLQQGYLGPQSKFQEWGMCPVTHNSPEITTDNGTAEIKLRTSKPMKVTANLVNCSTGEETKDYVFSQTEEQGNLITLVVILPSPGYFKLQIFALPTPDESKSLPNVYNYLIHNTAAPSGQVHIFPKQFAQWKDGCFLVKPYHLDDVNNADFEVIVPGAKAVAVTVDKEWFHFTKGAGDKWTGEVKDLGRFRGKGLKAVLNANMVADKSKYTSLLEYCL